MSDPRHHVPPENDPVDPPARPGRRGRHFETKDLHANLGQRTARGGIYTAASTFLNFLVTTTGTILITRQLTDQDFGLYGMVLVITGFAALFIDLGLSQAVVQKPEINHDQVSTLFWINLGIATGLSAVVAAATPLIVWFYDEPRIAPINLTLAGVFIISSLGLQHRALLRRRLEFGRLNIIESIVPLLATTVGVALAYAGAGVWALVALPVTSQTMMVLGMWVASGWVPGPPRRRSGVRTMLAFGGNVTGFQFINYFARNADNAMIGYAWGPGPLGLYTRAYSLMLMPVSKMNTPLTNLAVPALSRMQDQPDRYRRAYRNLISLSAGVATPIILFGIAISPELVPLVLGEQWDEIPIIFLALTGAAVHASTNAAAGWIYFSLGHVDRLLRWAMMSIPITLTGMAIGLQFGAIGVALAVSITQLSLKLPSLMYAMKDTMLTLSDFVRPAMVPILGPLLAMGACLWLTAPLDGVEPPMTVLAIKIIVFLSAYAAVLLLTTPGRTHIDSFRNAIKLVRKSV
ncbi:MAG: lipopolysaccharide biosynthesis protein [Planctomycetota bacterium]